MYNIVYFGCVGTKCALLLNPNSYNHWHSVTFPNITEWPTAIGVRAITLEAHFVVKPRQWNCMHVYMYIRIYYVLWQYCETCTCACMCCTHRVHTSPLSMQLPQELEDMYVCIYVSCKQGPCRANGWTRRHSSHTLQIFTCAHSFSGKVIALLKLVHMLQ